MATTPKGKVRFVVVYICKLLEDPENIKLQANEIAEYRWVDKEEYDGLLLYPETRQVLNKYFLKNH